MAEKRWISDEEWERRFDEQREAERIKEWEEWLKEHPGWWEERIAESNRKFAECRVGTGWNNNKPQKAQIRVLNGMNDKWEHGEMFYPHPVWWENEEIIKSLEESE